VKLISHLHLMMSFGTSGAKSQLRHTFFLNCCLSVHVDNHTIIVPKNALVFIKSTRYYNLYFLSLYS
jgi:hypothetical protein